MAETIIVVSYIVLTKRACFNISTIGIVWFFVFPIYFVTNVHKIKWYANLN